jgi:hypothetical protein
VFWGPSRNSEVPELFLTSAAMSSHIFSSSFNVVCYFYSSVVIPFHNSVFHFQNISLYLYNILENIQFSSFPTPLGVFKECSEMNLIHLMPISGEIRC